MVPWPGGGMAGLLEHWARNQILVKIMEFDAIQVEGQKTYASPSLKSL